MRMYNESNELDSQIIPYTDREGREERGRERKREEGRWGERSQRRGEEEEEQEKNEGIGNNIGSEGREGC